MRNRKSAALAAALFLFVGVAACTPGEAGPARIELNTSGPKATVDVVGLSAAELRAVEGERTPEEWSAILHVSVAQDKPQMPQMPQMMGSWSVAEQRLRFTPMFALDPGRQYEVTFSRPAASPLVATVSLPARDATPVTTVSQVYPTADIVPENQLRLYVHFSAPMGLKGGLPYIHLLDDQGNEVKDPFLPLDTEFWNDDRTRYTVFFDPGRQKRGIAPIAAMGRSLTEGKTYTLVVDAEWLDGNGLKLKEPFRRSFRVGAPDLRPLDPKSWKIQPPAAGSRGPLVVEFPEALDHGLLLRALGVAAGGAAVRGDVLVGDRERRWSFTPSEAWKPASYDIVAFAMLEDLAGNRIGRPFEVDQFDRTDRSAEPEKTLIPFTVR
jgi:hypothetical protein